MLGEVLGKRRKDIVLATKFTSPMAPGVSRKNASRHYIMTAVEASLRRLKTDWIDLYQMHYHDQLTPIEETLRALDDLIRQGKVRYIGCSNMFAWHVVEAQWTARHHNLHRFVSMQAEYSVSGARNRARLAARARRLPAWPIAVFPRWPAAS